MAKKTQKQILTEWQSFKENHLNGSSIVEAYETPIARAKRMKYLEANPEEWFVYYFSEYATAEPADFHKKSTKRIVANDEWFEVRSWSRELGKTTRTMMEIFYLIFTKRKKNVLLVSDSKDNAERLLEPYKLELEKNQRLIADYGLQVTYGRWESHDFKLKIGASFRALGKGGSPRGSKNKAVRPDVFLLDDFDTDEECRNPERVNSSFNWVEQALFPARSISKPTLILACGNIIAKDCIITRLAKRADKHDVVNIRDKDGKSSWSKNTEEHIDRVLKNISFNSAQKEYFNNPIVEGDIFKNIAYDKLPLLRTCEHALIYADPATSNKDKSGSHKAVVVMGKKGDRIMVYKVWLNTMNNLDFVTALFEAYLYCKERNVPHVKVHIENNSLQNPFYEQVIIPLIRKLQSQYGVILPITPDSRKKPEKFTRIEGTLEPLHRNGNLFFNEREQKTEAMQTMESQMLGVSPQAKIMDGPDAVEGGAHILLHKGAKENATYVTPTISNRRY